MLPNLRVLKWTCYSREFLLQSLCQTRAFTKLIFAPCMVTEFYAACDMAIFARVCPGLRNLVIDADAADDGRNLT